MISDSCVLKRKGTESNERSSSRTALAALRQPEHILAGAERDEAACSCLECEFI